MNDGTTSTVAPGTIVLVNTKKGIGVLGSSVIMYVCGTDDMIALDAPIACLLVSLTTDAAFITLMRRERPGLFELRLMFHTLSCLIDSDVKTS